MALRGQTRTKRRLLSGAKRRARIKGIPFDLTEEDFKLPRVCPVLAFPLRVNRGGKAQAFNSPTLDLIHPKLGYVPGNVLCVSSRANQIKSDATLVELRRVVKFYERYL